MALDPSFSFSPFILIDDSNPAIQYNGTWTPVTVTPTDPFGKNQNQIAGSPILSTVHVLRTQGLQSDGSFSYSFNGTGISVYATSLNVDQQYNAECFLDNGQHLNTTSQWTSDQPMCTTSNLSSEVQHNITVSVSLFDTAEVLDGKVSGFCFDFMLVEPSPTMTLKPYDLFIPMLNFSASSGTLSSDSFSISIDDGSRSNISATAGWNWDNTTGYQTLENGSQFRVAYTGIGLWWYGSLVDSISGASTSLAEWWLDDGPHISFSTIPIPFAGSDHLLFNASTSAMSTHIVSVKYDGNNGSAPLSLRSLVFQRNVPGTPSISPYQSNELFDVGNSGESVARGVIEGLLPVLAITILGYILYRRWRRKRKLLLAQEEETATAKIEAYILPPTVSTVRRPRKGGPIDLDIVSDDHIVHQFQLPPVIKRAGAGLHDDQMDTAAPTEGIPSQYISEHGNMSLLVVDSGPSSRQSPPVQPIEQSRRIETPIESLANNGPLEVSATLDASGGNHDAIREADSGLRLHDQTFIPILPPLYTLH